MFNSDLKAKTRFVGEFFGYCWLLGLILPGMGAVKNVGLYGSMIFALAVMPQFIKGNASVGVNLPAGLFVALAGWMGLTCLWSGDEIQSFREWLRNYGAASIAMIVTIFVFKEKRAQYRFSVFLILLTALAFLLYLNDWFRISMGGAVLFPSYPSMRKWGDPLIFIFPFLFALVCDREHALLRRMALFFMPLGVLFIVMTGGRGFWIAMLAVIVFWGVFNKYGRKFLAGLMVFLIAAGVILSSFNNPLSNRIQKIGYVDDRVNLAWLPALHIWKAAPAVGIGFGSQHYKKTMEDMITTAPDWNAVLSDDKKNLLIELGPHSNYLEVLSAGGGVAILLLILFYCSVVRAAFQLSTSGCLLAYAAASGIFAKYMIHGFVESVPWIFMGFFVGLLSLATDQPDVDAVAALPTWKGFR